jgi:acetyl-CoA carboxylase carboxyl transferase subunit alpha
LGGAQRAPLETAERIKAQLLAQLATLDEQSPEQLLESRYQRLMAFGIQ